MKCWHLVAALAIAGCGLNTSALPSTGRSAEDAGVSARDASQSIAGSPASWPARRRPSQLEQDGGSDTKDASKPGAGGPTTSDKDAQTDPAQGGPANPSGAPSPSGQPTSGGPSKPGSQAQPNSNGNGNGSNAGNGQNGSTSNGSAQDAGVADTGSSGSGSSGSSDPDHDSAPDDDEWSDEDDHSGSGDGDNGSPGSGSNGSDGQPHSDDAVSIIVDLVIAILDLSLGPVRPAELEALVSSILVFSLAPAELAGESLVAVLDALEDTQICLDHPERCNPLCTNLESDCSACGRDEDCIERIEEMCKVRLPKTCL